MAARQAHCAYLPDVSLFRYFILADRERARDDWAGTLVTGISGEVKVLSSHLFPLNPTRSLFIVASTGRDICSLLLGQAVFGSTPLRS
jgi:hypothetical protein